MECFEVIQAPCAEGQQVQWRRVMCIIAVQQQRVTMSVYFSLNGIEGRRNGPPPA